MLKTNDLSLVCQANHYYKLFITWTSQKIKKTFVQRNMFEFKHIKVCVAESLWGMCDPRCTLPHLSFYHIFVCCGSYLTDHTPTVRTSHRVYCISFLKLYFMHFVIPFGKVGSPYLGKAAAAARAALTQSYKCMLGVFVFP